MLNERWRLALAAGALIVSGTGGPARAQGVAQAQPAARQEPANGSAVTAASGCDGSTSTRPLTAWEQHKYHMQECVLGFPDEFNALPLGARAHQFYQAHVANAEAARMVLYQFDFVEGKADLTLRGHDQLGMIAGLLLHNNCPIIIERTPWNPGIAASRRVAVINEFARVGLPVPPERVVIGVPIANGLAGVEALAVYRNMMIQTLSGATQSAIAGGSGGILNLGSGTAGTGSGTSPGTAGTGAGAGGLPGSP
jgi:hypothetical protein